MACGAGRGLAEESLGLPAVTEMYEENPGEELYRKSAYIVPTEDTAAGAAGGNFERRAIAPPSPHCPSFEGLAASAPRRARPIRAEPVLSR